MTQELRQREASQQLSLSILLAALAGRLASLVRVLDTLDIPRYRLIRTQSHPAAEKTVTTYRDALPSVCLDWGARIATPPSSDELFRQLSPFAASR